MNERKLRGRSMKLRFSHCVKEYVDIDYADKLGAKELTWLSEFLDHEYNARPRLKAAKDERRSSYRRKYEAKSDLYTYWRRTEVNLAEIPSDIERDLKKERKRSSNITMSLLRALVSSN